MIHADCLRLLQLCRAAFDLNRRKHRRFHLDVRCGVELMLKECVCVCACVSVLTGGISWDGAAVDSLFESSREGTAAAAVVLVAAKSPSASLNKQHMHHSQLHMKATPVSLFTSSSVSNPRSHTGLEAAPNALLVWVL